MRENIINQRLVHKILTATGHSLPGIQNTELSICTVFFRGTKERGTSGRFDRFECVNNTQTFERETLWVMASRAAWHLFNSIVP